MHAKYVMILFLLKNHLHKKVIVKQNKYIDVHIYSYINKITFTGPNFDFI